MSPNTLDGAAHVVQLALTPIFLLTGVAQLINVFMTRLGRIADRLHHIQADRQATAAEVRLLRLRSHVLDVAVLLAALGGVLTCFAALVLFTGALTNRDAASALFLCFGAALGCTVCGLVAATAEVLLSSRTVREKADAAAATIAAHDGS